MQRSFKYTVREVLDAEFCIFMRFLMRNPSQSIESLFLALGSAEIC